MTNISEEAPDDVTQLIEKMKHDLGRLLEPFLFEKNNSVTRQAIHACMERHMLTLKSLQRIYDYVVRCDENINTSDRINRNELWVDIAVQPTKNDEFVYFPLSLGPNTEK